MHQANRTERITWKLSDELGTLLFQHRHLTPEVLQLTVDASQSGSGSPFPVVLVVIGAVHELVDLAPQEPEPGVPMDHADAVAELAGVNRIQDLLLGEAEPWSEVRAWAPTQ
jgi:hypothetical protein